MRRIADTIDTDPRTRRFRKCCDRSDIIDRAHYIRAMRKAYQCNVLLQQLSQIIQMQLTRLGINLPLQNRHTLVGQPAPRAAVRLVILVCDDNALTRLDPATDSLGQDIDVLCGGRTKRQLVGFDPQHGGQTHLRFVHFCTTNARRIIRCIGLHFAFGIKPVKSINHMAAGIGPACVLKEGLTLQGRLIKSGELGAHPCDI